MYFVFEATMRSWRNRLVQAEIMGPLPSYEPHWWLSQPLIFPLPPMTFGVVPKGPMPDNFWTGSIFDLYSVHLTDALNKVGVHFETFPAAIVDRKTGMDLPVQYEVFHLLEQHPALDKEQSDIGRHGIGKLVLSAASMCHNRPLFRVAEQFNIVLIRDDLRVALDTIGITGCTYTPVEEYQTVLLVV